MYTWKTPTHPPPHLAATLRRTLVHWRPVNGARHLHKQYVSPVAGFGALNATNLRETCASSAWQIQPFLCSNGTARVGVQNYALSVSTTKSGSTPACATKCLDILDFCAKAPPAPTGRHLNHCVTRCPVNPKSAPTCLSRCHIFPPTSTCAQRRNRQYVLTMKKNGRMPEARAKNHSTQQPNHQTCSANPMIS